MPVYSYLQILFFISEVLLLIAKRSKTNTPKNSRDKRSLLLLWIVIIACLSGGPFSAAYHVWSFNNYEAVVLTGEIICVTGFITRWIAILQLGKMFTVDVAIVSDHQLKTSGLYKIVRHPSYLGLILIIAGLAVCMNSVLSFLIMFVPTFLALNYRINIEEKALTDEFGDQYNQYQNKVKKLIPGIY
jgi:protein-S-isoprenylcysteine O-methyltransferase Ste14